MKVAIIGATGFVGSALLKEAVARGHKVTALVFNPSKVPTSDNVIALQADVLDQESLAAKLKGHDAVISAFSGHAQSDVLGYYVQGIQSIISAMLGAFGVGQYQPSVGRWPHRTRNGWSLILKREHLAGVSNLESMKRN